MAERMTIIADQEAREKPATAAAPSSSPVPREAWAARSLKRVPATVTIEAN